MEKKVNDVSQAVDPPQNARSHISNEVDQTLLEATRSPESLEHSFPSQTAVKTAVGKAYKVHSDSSPNHLGLEVGFILPGRYQVQQALGKGGYGSVYAGTDLNLDRAIAIKLLSHELEGQAAQRFKDEGRLIAKLQHPHIIQVYAFNELDFSYPFLVMERFGTGSLKDHWQKSEKPSLEEACHIIIQVLDALSAAHQIGVVHRDIKEANILYDHHKQVVKLCDFGIARAVEPLENQAQTTKEGCVIGTGHYIAPERYKGQNHDPRSDLYSVGVLFHRLLTGRRPHESYYGEPLAPGVLMYRSSYESLDYIEAVPRAIERICLRLLEANINLRFQNAKQAKLDLQEALNSPETQSYEYELNTHDPLKVTPLPNLEHPQLKEPITQPLSEPAVSNTALSRTSAPIAFLIGIALFILFWTLSTSQPRTIIKLGTTNTHSNSKLQRSQKPKPSKVHINRVDAQQPLKTSEDTQLTKSKSSRTLQKNKNYKPKLKKRTKSKASIRSKSKIRARDRAKVSPKDKSKSPYIFPVQEPGEASPQD